MEASGFGRFQRLSPQGHFLLPNNEYELSIYARTSLAASITSQIPGRIRNQIPLRLPKNDPMVI